jgi:hypothetical protein
MAALLKDWEAKPQVSQLGEIQKSPNSGKLSRAARLNADEGFFLAMAHWQLGEKDKAREWFARSVQWMEKGTKEDAELKRFRAEAAGLLGVEKKD